MACSSSLLSSLVLISLFFSFSEANKVLVGGKKDSWKIPSSQSDSLNKWSQNARFRVGDSLVVHFNPEKDSVLQVSKKDYNTCNTTNPIMKYNNETTTILLDRSGPFYFISGANGHCEQGQKMIVVVLSEIHWKKTSPSPAPSPSESFDAAPSPTSAAAGGLMKGSLFIVLGSLLMRVVLG